MPASWRCMASRASARRPCSSTPRRQARTSALPAPSGWRGRWSSRSHLPGPQRDALEVALGLNVGRPPNPFLAGLAALILLSEAAEEQPLFCLVDDAQWLDRASARV